MYVFIDIYIMEGVVRASPRRGRGGGSAGGKRKRPAPARH